MHQIGRPAAIDIATHASFTGMGAPRTRPIREAAHARPMPSSQHNDPDGHWRVHTTLITRLACRYHRPGRDMSALIRIGYLSLHEAATLRLPAEALTARIMKVMRRYALTQEIRSPEGRGGVSSGHRQLTLLGHCLLARARRDCVREGAEPLEAALFARVARRLGVSPAAVARTLKPAAHAEKSSGAPVARLDEARARRRLMTLAESVLGAQERVVFLAYHGAVGATPESLALTLGFSSGRVTLLKRSAHRKLAIAALGEGLKTGS